MMERHFWSGNIAIAEAALTAGLNFYAGYPITPSSDLMEYIARNLPKRGGIFVQGEDELSSINMVIGASIAGAKAMTATSGPGFSLMQEALGMAIMLEIPLVLVDVMRLGPSTGQATKSGQGDVMQARWGRHGDQALVVLTASSPQSAYQRTIDAFNISEMLRTPVILLIDELTAHLWETVTIDKDQISLIERRYGKPGDAFFDSGDPSIPPPMPRIGEGYNVLYTTSTHDGFGIRKTQDAQIHNHLVRRIYKKIWNNVEYLFNYNIYPVDMVEKDKDIIIISYCSTARVASETVEKLNKEGFVAMNVELRTLWPINYDELSKIIKDAGIVVVPEMNLGQIIYDIKIIGNGLDIYSFNKIGGGIPIYPDELYNYIIEAYRK